MLVDLEEAKQQLRRIDDDDDERIMRVMAQASALVIDFLKLPAGTYEATDGSPDDVPELVKAATLIVIENMYDSPQVDPLSESVRSILHRSRDPALA